jgi:hypothetical protein
MHRPSGVGRALGLALVVALVLAASVALPGCGRCLVGSPSSGVECATTGSGTLVAAPGLSSSKPLRVRFGLSCFTPASCFGGLTFSVRDTPTDPPGFEFDVVLPAVSGDFTVTNPQVTGNWSPTGPGAPLDGLTFVSGTVDVQGASDKGFSASFAFEFLTSDGDPVSVTAGQAVVSNCHTVTGCGE